MPHTTPRRASTTQTDPDLAVAEIAAQLGPAADGGVVFFCSAAFDLPRLGAALRRHFTGPLTGCTSSGQIGPAGFQPDGMVAIGFPASSCSLHTYGLRGLRDCESAAAEIARRVAADRAQLPDRNDFGLLLVDGLSLAEERVVAALYQALGHVPLIGGSAGDNLDFAHTYVFVDDAFVEDAAVLAVVSTQLPVRVLKFEHFAPTLKRMVVTDADPAARTIRSLNGYPAAEVYAEAIGVGVEQLDAATTSASPVMLRIGDDYFVRSIARVNPDRSLTLFCAIERGMVLTVGEPGDMLAQLERELPANDGGLVIGCDCILRRLELERRGNAAAVGEFLGSHNVVGFSTYGEQYNGNHLNQTFVGVAIGDRRA